MRYNKQKTQEKKLFTTPRKELEGVFFGFAGKPPSPQPRAMIHVTKFSRIQTFSITTGLDHISYTSPIAFRGESTYLEFQSNRWVFFSWIGTTYLIGRSRKVTYKTWRDFHQYAFEATSGSYPPPPPPKITFFLPLFAFSMRWLIMFIYFSKVAGYTVLAAEMKLISTVCFG